MTDGTSNRCPPSVPNQSDTAIYADDVAVNAERSPRPIVPGGIKYTRRAIKRLGGVIGVGVALGLWLLGMVFKVLLGGSLGGVASFGLTVLALPVLPIFGVPAVSSASRIMLAVAISAVLWWIVGQIAAGKVANKPVVGWRDWAREFAIVGLGLWCGALGSLLLGALLLGAL